MGWEENSFDLALLLCLFAILRRLSCAAENAFATMTSVTNKPPCEQDWATTPTKFNSSTLLID